MISLPPHHMAYHVSLLLHHKISLSTSFFHTFMIIKETSHKLIFLQHLVMFIILKWNKVTTDTEETLHLHCGEWEQKLKTIIISAFNSSHWNTMRDKNWTAKEGRNCIIPFPKPQIFLSLMWCACWIWHPRLLCVQCNPQIFLTHSIFQTQVSKFYTF